MIRRHKKVENSYSGQFISPDSNYTVKCPEGTKARDPFVETNKNMSDRSLKLMALMSGNGCFFLFSKNFRYFGAENLTKK